MTIFCQCQRGLVCAVHSAVQLYTIQKVAQMWRVLKPNGGLKCLCPTKADAQQIAALLNGGGGLSSGTLIGKTEA